MSSLLILLPPQPPGATTEFAFALSADRRTVQQHGSSPASLLPQPRGAGAEVVALVPVQSVSWHQVELPKGVGSNSPRLRSVLEGLLEERLLEEPEALHFALQPQPAGGTAWVAVCQRAWLRGHLQLLESAGRAVTRIVPEFTPGERPALHALGDPDKPVLVASGPHGVLALPLAAGALPLLPSVAETVPTLAEPAVAALAEQVLQHKVELQQAPQRWLLAAQSAWDLAQFDLSSSSRTRAFKKLASGWTELLRAPHWRPARWGAALLLALNVLGLNAWAWKERAALDAKREAVRETFTRTFPQVKTVIDAPLQMEREVAALRQRAGVASGRDFESMLAALAGAVPPGRIVGGLEFNGNELRVRGLSLTTEELAPVASNLKSVGYSATLRGDVLLIALEAAP